MRPNYIRTAAIIFLTLLFAGFLCAAIPADNLIKNTLVLLPKSSKVRFNWLTPPAPEKFESAQLIFRMDDSGRVWFGRDGKYILAPGNSFAFSLNELFDDFVATGKNSLLFAAKGYLGIIPPYKASKKLVESFAFQPLVKLPAENCRLFPAAAGYVYIAGLSQRDGSDELYLAGGSDDLKLLEGRGTAFVYKKIFTSGKRISAVAGDGKTTFIAAESLVVCIKTGADKIEGIFKHPVEQITGLAYDRSAGLFYCTQKGVGYAGENGSVEFLKVINPQIAISAGKLYVYIRDENAVLEISGINDFKGYINSGGVKK
jgi:hypothetical protein